MVAFTYKRTRHKGRTYYRYYVEESLTGLALVKHNHMSWRIEYFGATRYYNGDVLLFLNATQATQVLNQALAEWLKNQET